MNLHARPAALATTLTLALLPPALGWVARAPGVQDCAAPAAVDPDPGHSRPAWSTPWLVRCGAAQTRVSGAAAVLLGRPVDVNAASARELRAIPGVSRGLAESIVEERLRGGSFVDEDDLQRVPGIAARRVARLAPYLVFAAAGP